MLMRLCIPAAGEQWRLLFSLANLKPVSLIEYSKSKLHWQGNLRSVIYKFPILQLRRAFRRMVIEAIGDNSARSESSDALFCPSASSLSCSLCIYQTNNTIKTSMTLIPWFHPLYQLLLLSLKSLIPLSSTTASLNSVKSQCCTNPTLRFLDPSLQTSLGESLLYHADWCHEYSIAFDKSQVSYSSDSLQLLFKA